MRQISLRIGGMSCDHCVRAVRGALKAIPGVTVEGVTIGAATVDIDPSQATVDQVVAAIGDAGYEVLEPIPW